MDGGDGKGTVPQADGRIPIERRISELRSGLENGCRVLTRRADTVHEKAGGRSPSRRSVWQDRIGRIRTRASSTSSIEELESLCREAGVLEDEISKAEEKLVF